MRVELKVVRSAIVLAACALATVGASAWAQSTDEDQNLPPSYNGPASAVAAIVDDKVITTYDVAQRMQLMIISSGREIPQEFLPRLQQQALQDLVEEHLKIIESKTFDLAPEPAEVEEEMRNMAAQNNMTPSQLEQSLAVNGIDIETLRQQVRARIVWSRLVQGRYGERVRVDDDDVEETLQRMREEATSEQYLVSEVCIPVANPSEAQQIYEGSMQLIEQMRRGVPFAVVAQQFSACTSAAAGGDLGWVRSGELPPEIDEVIKELPPGSVTNPIPSEGAFMIFAVRDKREATPAGEPTFTLAYGGAPLSVGRAAARTALEELKTADACGGRALRRDLGADVSVAMLENVQLDDIDERFRDSIEGLDRGDLSPAMEADDTLHMVYVCEKDEGLGLPSRDALEDRLYSRQLERIAQQYLRDVERKTMVDIRLKSPQQQAQNNG